MSRETASVESDSEEAMVTSVFGFWKKWYHVSVLVGVMAFMLWVRVQDYAKFSQGDQVLFSGNDAYYHFRQVSYTVDHWPWSMPFDPWTGFPYGTAAGQFGTLYDQIIATAAMVVGLGDPSAQTIAMVTVIAPTVFGALVAVPVFYVGRHLHNRSTGVMAAILLALMPGTFLARSTAGFADHQVAEVLFIAIATLAVMKALRVAEKEVPVFEQVIDRDWDGLKGPVLYSVLAGVALSLYIWVWPPGVVLVGILGVFFTIALAADFLRGRSPDHVATVGIVSMAVVAVFTAVQIQTFEFSTTDISPVQVVLSLAVMVWCIVVAALARIWESRDLPSGGFPALLFGLIVGGLVFLSVALPSLYGTILNNAFKSFGFGQSASTLTIAEAKPTPGIKPFDAAALSSFLFRQYGLVFVISLISLVWMSVHTYLTKYRSDYLFLVVWTAFTWMLALTQVRFHYYLVIPLVILSAWGLSRAGSSLGLSSAANALVFVWIAGSWALGVYAMDFGLLVIGLLGIVSLLGLASVIVYQDRLSLDWVGEVKAYQVFAVFAIFLLVFAPLLPPIAAASAREAQQDGRPQFVVDAGKTRPAGTTWADTGEWMQANTPDPESEDLQYYGTFERTDDHDYPPSAYGVMAWWDYGHWITVLAERIPHANPFQQNARSASSFFQASSEERAGLILEAIPSMQGEVGKFDELTNADLRELIAGQSDQKANEDVRYVMIDDATAGGKFNAIQNWATPPNSSSAYFESRRYQIRSGGSTQNASLRTYTEAFEQTMTYKLYYEDANGLSHYRLVRESEQYSIVGSFLFRDGRMAGLYSDSTIFDDGWNSTANQFSSQLFQLRRRGQAYPLGGRSYTYNSHLESELKVFERVPGATVTGRVENASNASAAVTLRLQTAPGRNFSYSQRVSLDEDGSFEVTVPYATDNSVSPSEDGTDASVEATSDYSVRVIGGGSIETAGTFEVSESAIYDGTAVEVEPFDDPFGSQNDSTNGESGSDNSSEDSGGNGSDSSGSESIGADFGSWVSPVPSLDAAPVRAD